MNIPAATRRILGHIGVHPPFPMDFSAGSKPILAKMVCLGCPPQCPRIGRGSWSAPRTPPTSPSTTTFGSNHLEAFKVWNGPCMTASKQGGTGRASGKGRRRQVYFLITLTSPLRSSRAIFRFVRDSRRHLGAALQKNVLAEVVLAHSTYRSAISIRISLCPLIHPRNGGRRRPAIPGRGANRETIPAAMVGPSCSEPLMALPSIDARISPRSSRSGLLGEETLVGDPNDAERGKEKSTARSTTCRRASWCASDADPKRRVEAHSRLASRKARPRTLRSLRNLSSERVFRFISYP